MLLQEFPSGPLETNAYILACSKSKKAVIIDPSPGSCPLLRQFVEKNHLTVSAIWLTHSHWDHLADLPAVKTLYPVAVWVHALDAPNVQQPGSDCLPVFPGQPAVKPDAFFSDGQWLEVGELKVQVLETPGHTPGGVCFYLPQQKTLISGDTLFQGAMGRVDFPTSDPQAMRHSLLKLSKLPGDVQVYPGHGASTTIGAESWIKNPML